MVYMHFPHNLTEEEEVLQKKYAKLRKKKKALAELRKPKPEPKEPPKEQLKRKTETAASATEQAKKLLKLGAIKVNTERKETQTFKRTKRQKGEDKSSVGFQPFSPQHNEEETSAAKPPVEQGGPPGTPGGSRDRPDRPRMKGLYDSFVPRNRGEGREEGRPKYDREDRRERDMAPKKGNTIYIFGINLTESLVKKAFSNFGAIVNITMEPEKNCAFVTFEKMEDADEAIAQMHGSMQSGVQLRVQLARRQPSFEPTQSDPSSNSWSTIAASHSQKGSFQDKRDLVAYDGDDPFA